MRKITFSTRSAKGRIRNVSARPRLGQDAFRAAFPDATTYEEAIPRMEPHLQQEPDGTFTLAVQKAEDIGIDPVIFADLRRSLEQTNKNVREGLYRVGDEWKWNIN